MRPRYLLTLLFPLLASSLLGQNADLQLNLDIAATSLRTGQRFTATLRVKNHGPDTATGIRAFLQPNIYLVEAQAPAGWTCTGTILTCSAPSLAAGREEQMTLTLLAPTRHEQAGSVFTFSGTVHADSTDPDATNNTVDRVVGLTHLDTIADLAVTAGAQQVREGTFTTLPVTVKNLGPTEARDVLLLVHGESSVPFAIDGPQWTCTNPGPRRAECTRALLPAGTTDVLNLRFTAPQQESAVLFRTHVSSDGNRDQEPANNFAQGRVNVGSAENWHRILIPLSASETPGANGSRWRTKTTMLVAQEGDAEFLLRPHPCDYILMHCFPQPVPLRVPFDPAGLGFLLDTHGVASGGSQFLYVRASEASKLRVNSRVYDVSREQDTAGSELPIAREHDFRTASFSLLGIPVRPQYRYTLRVYDADGRDGAQVAVRIFAGDEAEPRTTVAATLVRRGTFVTTAAELPVRPAYLQLDPAALAPLEGFEEMRIDVQPLTPGLRVWGFVSVTDNDTHHVTTFSAQ